MISAVSREPWLGVVCLRGCRISRAEVGWGVTKLVWVDSDSATLVVAITAGAPGSEAASTGAEVAGEALGCMF